MEDADLSGFEHMNFIEDLDLVYTNSQKTYTITREQMEQIKQKIFIVARLAKLEMLKTMRFCLTRDGLGWRNPDEIIL